MSNQDKDGSKTCCDCFPGMSEMMRAMMQGKGGSCCAPAKGMSEMMPECCSVDQKEGRTDKPGEKNPE